ncbi:magnesium transporter CorA family protein [Candidatus Saccharibacteria bacterium oral taxon 488]|jgi:mg2+ transporter protein, corA-like protein|nr:magnesium transporter CorA family protein [Candidatus Saccharibacteria bacterium oral taxon 488]QJU08706.1 magnesium transporter CorA family protein [Candidatus Saccharibacteria bacterium oral taxon 488]QJU09564.1 magnesium transporter CorA family protein [Candidatus Saccharibacteria bacterium oral taxon 488]
MSYTEYMIEYLHSTGEAIAPIQTLRSGSWLRCERPTEEEVSELLTLGMDEDMISDALDPHEVPRIEFDDEWTYLIARLPDTDDDFNDFTTPILFGIHKEYVVTLSRDSLGRLWQPFIDKTRVRTSRRIELVVAMIEAVSSQYQRRVATINRQMRAATDDIHTLRARDIVTLTEYERKLNDYLDALLPMNWAIERLIANRSLRLKDDDKDDVEDISIDLEQVISRCKSLLRTITNVRDSYRAVMDTRLNETIRLLTVITVALTIPTMVAGLYGMNVPLPAAESPVTFWVVIGGSALAALAIGYYFLKRR